MEPRIIAEYSFMEKGELDRCYQLFEDGRVIYTYDKSRYPGGQNKQVHLSFCELSENIKQELKNDSIKRLIQKIDNFS